MASPQAPEKFFFENKMQLFWKDGDYSTSADIDEWVDSRDFAGIAVGFTAGNLTGAGVKAMSIIADEESDGSGGNVVIATWSGDVGTAEGDYLVLEATAEQIRQEGADQTTPLNLRYVSVMITLANAADEAVVVYVQWGARHARTGLTADSIT